jgi:phosphoserine aminotransferase
LETVEAVMPPVKPSVKPADPRFSCGPTAKHPGWDPAKLDFSLMGRSHRSPEARARIRELNARIRRVLGVPDDYLIGITAGSDTGAVEMALWSLLGARPVDLFGWEAFGLDWVVDTMEQLKPAGANAYVPEYGVLPDLSRANPKHDCVFTWNGTASGVRVPNGDWISDAREGLTICDATSAVFVMDMPWSKLDVTTFSWQKALGSEPAHGTIIMSPRAIQRLETHRPAWPIPKLYRLVNKGKVNLDFFDTEVINTPSLMCIEDAIDALKWAEGIGGRPAMAARTRESYGYIEAWVARTPWIDFLARDPATRSQTSACLIYTDPDYLGLNPTQRAEFARRVYGLLEGERVALDANAYKDAPPGLRIWCGATVEPSNVAALLPWIDWAFATVKADMLVPA